MSENPATLGDAPIEPQLHGLLNELARGIDDILNLGKPEKENGFVLLVFPLEDHGGRCNYISNTVRSDVVVLLRAQLALFEGRVASDGTA